MEVLPRAAIGVCLFGALSLFASPESVADNGLHQLREKVNSGTVGVLSARSDSTFTRLADDMGIVLDDDNLRVLTTLGGGSLQNVEDLLVLRGIDVAFTQADTLSFYDNVDVFPGLKNLISYIAKVHDEEFHLLTTVEINNIDDLAGKRVNFGKEGTGTFLTSSIVFDKLGLTVEATTYPHSEAFELLKSGEIAAMAKVDGKPVGLLQKASLDDRVHLIEVPYERLSDTYNSATLSHQDYPELFAPNDYVDTVSVPSLLAVYNWPTDHPRGIKVNRFIEALFERFGEFTNPAKGFDDKWQQINLGDEVPGWTRASKAAEILESSQTQ
ncbi:MAG: TAXI family TRAP transporter solute-binding subunit [Geminicoccaceae bacterium]